MLGPSVGPLNLFLQGRPDLCHQTLRRALEGLMRVEGFLPLCDIHCRNADGNFVFPPFESQLRAATSAMRVDMGSMCYHYHGEFVADRMAVRGAVERHGAVMRDVLVPGLEEGNDAPMGHALERLWLSIFLPPPVVDPITGLPKRIWILWEQGWDEAPYLQQQVAQSWRCYNPGWEIVLVDKPSLRDWMHGDADYLFDPTKDITFQSRSDVIRLTLLNRYTLAPP
jgi:Capsular polysaccharide synthesis protein